MAENVLMDEDEKTSGIKPQKTAERLGASFL
jgi:hypothetical protein